MREFPDVRPTNLRYLALALLAVTSASAYLARYCISVCATSVEHDLDIDHEWMSYVFASFMVGYLLGQIPGGRLGERIGTRRALAALIAVWSAFTAWSAYSGSVKPMIAAQFAVGLAQAGLVPITSIAVKDWFPASRRGFPSSVIAASMSAGGVAAMWLTGQLVASWNNDWQRVFLLYALVGIAWSIVFYVFFRDRPAEHPWINGAEVRLIAQEEAPRAEVRPPADARPPEDAVSRKAPVAVAVDVAPPAHAVPTAATDSSVTGPARGAPRSRVGGNVELAIRMVSSVSVWALACQWFFRSAGYQFFARWFPAFLEERYDLKKDQSGYFAAWPLLGVAVGSIVGGFLVDWALKRTGRRWISRNLISIVSLLLCAACVGASESCASARSFAFAMALGAFFSGMSMPTGWAATIDLGGRRTALMFAVMNMAATFAGIVAPTKVGAMMKSLRALHESYAPVVYLHVWIYAIAAAAWLLVDTNRSVDGQDLAEDFH